jgi:hypothetical protein
VGAKLIVRRLWLMEHVWDMQQAALRMRELAQDATLPGSAEKMIQAAKDLEQRSIERAQLRTSEPRD